MRKRSIVKLFLVIVAITAALLVFSASRQGKKNACKESLDTCCKPIDKGGKMIWENLSRQFFSSI